jgi:hypothetical protein
VACSYSDNSATETDYKYSDTRIASCKVGFAYLIPHSSKKQLIVEVDRHNSTEFDTVLEVEVKSVGWRCSLG